MNIRKTNGMVIISSFDNQDCLFTRRYMFYTLTQAKKLFKKELFLHNNKLNNFINREA